MRARQESTNSLPTDPMDRRLLSLTNQNDDDDLMIHTLVSTNDINLQIMEFLDVKSLVRFGITCRGPHYSLPLELSHRSQRLKGIVGQVNVLLHHGVAMTDDVDVDPNARAHMPGMEECNQATNLIREAGSFILGCFPCDRNSRFSFPLFREEKSGLDRVVWGICLLESFFQSPLLSIYNDVPVLESEVETATKTSILFFQALHVNYMGSFRTHDKTSEQGNKESEALMETYRAYATELTRDIEVWKTFKQAAHDLIPLEKLPAFRIAAWRKVVSLQMAATCDGNLQYLDCAFISAMVRVAAFDADGNRLQL